MNDILHNKSYFDESHRANLMYYVFLFEMLKRTNPKPAYRTPKPSVYQPSDS
jgi:hypothetical protein